MPSISCLFARAKLAQAVTDLRPTTLGEKAAGLYKAALLSGPHVFAVKMMGDAGMLFTRVLLDQPIATGLDALQATARSAATMFEKPATSFRTVPGTLFDGKAWQAMREGLGPDTQKALKLFTTGVDPDHAGAAWDLGRTSFGNPALTRILNGTSNAIEGMTKIPYGLAFRESLVRHAKLLAMHEGGEAADVATATDRYLANPTSEMLVTAMNAGERAVFKNRTLLGDVASGIKSAAARSSPVAQLGAELALPFTRVPSAVFMQGIERSPIGLASAVVDVARAAFGKTSPEAEALAVRLSKGLTGSAAWLGLGTMLYKAGKLTGNEPDDPRQRAMWQLTGKIPNAVKIGDRWQSITSFGPFAFPLEFAANALQHGDATRRGAAPGFRDLAAGAGEAALTMLTEGTYLRNLAGIGEALKGKGTTTERLAAGYVPVPGALTAAEQATDPYQRDAKTLVQMLQRRVPGAAQSLPAKLDALGRPVPNDQSLVGALGLSRGSDVRHDPVVDAAQQYGVDIGFPGHELKFRGQPTQQMTDDQYRALLALRGQTVERAVGHLIASPSFDRLPTDGAKHSAILKVLERADEMTRKQFTREQASMRPGQP